MKKIPHKKFLVTTFEDGVPVLKEVIEPASAVPSDNFGVYFNGEYYFVFESEREKTIFYKKIEEKPANSDTSFWEKLKDFFSF